MNAQSGARFQHLLEAQSSISFATAMHVIDMQVPFEDTLTHMTCMYSIGRAVPASISCIA